MSYADDLTTKSDQLEERLQDLHRELYGPVDRHLYDRTLEALGQELCEQLFGFSLGSELGLNGRADLEAESYVTTWVDGLRELARSRGLLGTQLSELAPPDAGHEVIDLNATRVLSSTPPGPMMFSEAWVMTFGEAWATGARCYRCGEQVPEGDQAEIVVQLDGVDVRGVPTGGHLDTHVIVHTSTCRREGDALA